MSFIQNEAMFGCAASVELSTSPIPRKAFDVVEDEQPFENALIALTAYSKCEDAIFCQRSIF